MNPHSLLDFGGWNRKALEGILDRAQSYLPVLEGGKKLSVLSGLTICTAFFENSTRTRTSFELAAKRLGADVLSFAAGSSSVSKGESLRDTLEVLTAYGVNAYVVRHHASGAAHLTERYGGRPVVNAGDGRRAHPTQALLDALTIRQEFGSLDGKKVAILGDVLHSRVARSNVELLGKLGAKVTLCAPATLLPPLTGAHRTTDPREAVMGADVVMALRLQRERMNGGYLGSLDEYAHVYQVNDALLEYAAPHAIVLHPGPMNREVEISSEIADGSRSRILRQVTNGQVVRMSVLTELLAEDKNQ